MNQRATLITLQILMAHFAKANPAPFLALLPDLVARARDADASVAAAGLVCLASAWCGRVDCHRTGRAFLGGGAGAYMRARGRRWGRERRGRWRTL